MTRSRVWLAALSAAASVAVLSAAASAGAGVEATDPGVTATSIVLGGTAPLSGSGAASSSVTHGAAAYLAHVNSLGGVHGRRILYRVLDDRGDPARALDANRRLVEEVGAFAVFNPVGTEHALAARGYLNAAGVPQLFVASGATTFGADAARYPFSSGFRPSYAAEGRVLGEYVARSSRGATVAVLAQDDAFGRELLGGLRRGVSGSSARIVAVERYDAAAPNVRDHINVLKASGAGSLALFASPAVAAQAYVQLGRLGWSPSVLTSAAASSSGLMARASKGGRRQLVRGTVSAGFLKDPTDPAWTDDPGVRLYRAIMAKHAAARNPRDILHLHGMAAAHTLVEALKRTGSDVSRASLLDQARNLRVPGNPFLLPGIEIRTGGGDQFPIEQLQLRRWGDRGWRAFGGLWGRRTG